MKHLYHILLPVYIGLLSSCTYHFELDDVGASPKLVLYSYPGSGDTTVVQPSRQSERRARPGTEGSGRPPVRKR